jgi:nucleotide-binding universal stress UspA family protein
MSGRIVVGVDGSDGARRALEWAVEEARLRQAGLLVVHAWQVPPLVAGAGPFDAPLVLDADTIERVEKTAEEIVERELAAVDTSELDVQRLVAARSAADALVDAGADADLLVVGTRGRGGFAGLLLGSVGHQVAHHAPCPVVIVPNR